MKHLPCRFIIAAILGLMCVQAIAVASIFETALSSPYRFDDMIIFAAILLSGLALLVRRQRNWRNELKHLQARLSTEHQLRVNAEKTLLETDADLREALVARDTIMATERHRIARDIHDDLGQHLLALKIDISLLNANSHTFKRQLDLIRKNIDLTIRSLRTIINDLRPIALADGLQNALERQLDEFARINSIRCKLDAEKNALQAASSHFVEAILFRMLQESLSNVSRHAKASEVEIALRLNLDHLSMTVHDNGIGMSIELEQRGCGLHGIQDRIDAAGGFFYIESTPGKGTNLLMSIPLNK